MTARQMYEKAMTLLGYTNNVGELSGEEEMIPRAIPLINTVYSDLFYIFAATGFNPITKIDDIITMPTNAPERILHDVMPYGVAMWLAQSESDGDNQQMFSVIYNKKRAGLSFTDSVSDVLPVTEDGVI